jgi:hypothetical protein
MKFIKFKFDILLYLYVIGIICWLLRTFQIYLKVERIPSKKLSDYIFLYLYISIYRVRPKYFTKRRICVIHYNI